jgi:translation initiation factor IF-1
MPRGMEAEEQDTAEPGRNVEATVLEILPNGTYLVKLDSQQQVRAHAASTQVRNFMRMRPGDRVRVSLSPHDPSRGRVTEILSS